MDTWGVAPSLDSKREEKGCEIKLNMGNFMERGGHRNIPMVAFKGGVEVKKRRK